MTKEGEGNGIQEHPQETLTWAQPDMSRDHAGCGRKESFIHRLPKFDMRELKVGKVLGKGGFGVVYEVHRFHVTQEAFPEMCHRIEALGSQNENDDDDDDSQLLDRCVAFVEQVCRRKRQRCSSLRGTTRYALKMLKPELVLRQGMQLLKGAADLAVEAQMLASIDHPNIIRLRGLSNASPYSPDFFLIIDKLQETLRNRVRQWDDHIQQLNRITGHLDPGASNKVPLYEERLRVARDLASAFEYLHSHRIVYRDIKQDNLGFDVFGKIKVFDFGLARALPSENAISLDGTYCLTGLTGSSRYMAPEVANSKKYNTSCDTYSFAILLWELLVLRDAFDDYTVPMMQEKVYNGQGNRPSINISWSDAIKELLSQCWSPKWEERWNMYEIVQVLQLEIVDCGEEIEKCSMSEQQFSKNVHRQEEIASCEAEKNAPKINCYPRSISRASTQKLPP